MRLVHMQSVHGIMSESSIPHCSSATTEYPIATAVKDSFFIIERISSPLPNVNSKSRTHQACPSSKATSWHGSQALQGFDRKGLRDSGADRCDGQQWLDQSVKTNITKSLCMPALGGMRLQEMPCLAADDLDHFVERLRWNFDAKHVQELVEKRYSFFARVFVLCHSLSLTSY